MTKPLVPADLLKSLQAADKPAAKPTDNPEKLMRIGDDPAGGSGEPDEGKIHPYG